MPNANHNAQVNPIISSIDKKDLQLLTLTMQTRRSSSAMGCAKIKMAVFVLTCSIIVHSFGSYPNDSWNENLESTVAIMVIFKHCDRRIVFAWRLVKRPGQSAQIKGTKDKWLIPKERYANTTHFSNFPRQKVPYQLANFQGLHSIFPPT